jgi:hypothetical protein
MTPREAFRSVSETYLARLERYATDLLMAGDPDAMAKIEAYRDQLSGELDALVRKLKAVSLPKVLN